MNPGEAVRWLETSLDDAGLDDARIEAEALVMSALAANRASLYAAWRDDVVTAAQERSLSNLLERRLSREPLAYVVGHREFYGLDLLVDQRALIPRPETELLVDLALEAARGVNPAGRVAIADVGAGCGAVAIALAHHLPHATVWAVDLSAAALQVAAANANRYGVAERVTLLHGDLLTPLPAPVDIIVSNPPYVPQDVLPRLAPEVLREPRQALDGGVKGLSVIERLLQQAPAHLAAPGALLLECSPEQANDVERMARHAFPSAEIEIAKDLAGRDRVLSVQAPAVRPLHLAVSEAVN